MHKRNTRYRLSLSHQERKKENTRNPLNAKTAYRLIVGQKGKREAFLSRKKKDAKKRGGRSTPCRERGEEKRKTANKRGERLMWKRLGRKCMAAQKKLDRRSCNV